MGAVKGGEVREDSKEEMLHYLLKDSRRWLTWLNEGWISDGGKYTTAQRQSLWALCVDVVGVRDGAEEV